MSKETDHNNLPPEIQSQLELLKVQQDLFQSFSDLERFPPHHTMYWLGLAIINLLRDESFYSLDENTTAEAGALLESHFSATFRVLDYLEGRGEID